MEKRILVQNKLTDTDVLLNCENLAYFIPHLDSVLFCAPMPVILTYKIKTKPIQILYITWS